MYDVAIIGAGPAGSTCARLLGGKMKVLLVDRSELLSEAAPGHALRLETRDGKKFTERARLLVGCDGAGSLVRRRLLQRVPHPRTYIALQEWFEQEAEPLPYFGAVFWSRVTDFYAFRPRLRSAVMRTWLSSMRVDLPG